MRKITVDDSVEFHIPDGYKECENWEDTVGIGHQGIVIKAFDIKTKEAVAIKKCTRAFDNERSAKNAFREINLLQSINHQNVIKLLDIYTPQENIEEFSDVYLIMEQMEADLSKVISSKRYDQERISFFMYQLLCGVNYLHKKGIMHRDITVKNIGYKFGVLKILDFGKARREDSTVLTGYVTSRYYRAPEIVLQADYGAKADVWSLGCIFGELITGEVLFRGGNEHLDQWKKIVAYLGRPKDEFFDTITNNAIKSYVKSSYSPPATPSQEINKWKDLFPDSKFVPCPKFDELTAENARGLISKMLVIDPRNRISCRDAIEHSYVSLWKNDEEVDGIVKPINNATDNGQQHDLKEWKRLIFNQIKSFRLNKLE